jgi:hypothetical protein
MRRRRQGIVSPFRGEGVKPGIVSPFRGEAAEGRCDPFLATVPCVKSAVLH